jgi:predicted phosphate transport protein (TIGR00153 family)
MGSLIEFMKRKTAANVLEKSINHARQVQKCVKKLNEGVQLLLKSKKTENSHDIFLEVDALEGEADTMRRDIMKDVSKGELNPSVRTDLSHLVKRMDDVANCANGVGRRIDTISNKFWEQSSEETINLISQMMSKSVECVEFLDKILLDLLGDRSHVKEIASKINNLEHQVDVLNINLRRSLQQTDYKVNPFTIFTVGMTMNIIEAISDSIESVADYIMVLLTSSEAL